MHTHPFYVCLCTPLAIFQAVLSFYQRTKLLGSNESPVQVTSVYYRLSGAFCTFEKQLAASNVFLRAEAPEPLDCVLWKYSFFSKEEGEFHFAKDGLEN